MVKAAILTLKIFITTITSPAQEAFSFFCLNTDQKKEGLLPDIFPLYIKTIKLRINKGENQAATN